MYWKWKQGKFENVSEMKVRTGGYLRGEHKGVWWNLITERAVFGLKRNVKEAHEVRDLKLVAVTAMVGGGWIIWSASVSSVPKQEIDRRTAMQCRHPTTGIKICSHGQHAGAIVYTGALSSGTIGSGNFGECTVVDMKSTYKRGRRSWRLTGRRHNDLSTAAL